MLETEESAMDDLVSGWVFQDPWTGDLWPFFSRQLQLQETALLPDRNRLALVLDKAGVEMKFCSDFFNPAGSAPADSKHGFLQNVDFAICGQRGKHPPGSHRPDEIDPIRPLVSVRMLGAVVEDEVHAAIT